MTGINATSTSKPRVLGEWAWAITEEAEVENLSPQPPAGSAIKPTSEGTPTGTVTPTDTRNIYDLVFPTDNMPQGTVWYEDEYYITSPYSMLIPTEPFEYTLDPTGAAVAIAELVVSRIRLTGFQAFVRITGVIKTAAKFSPTIKLRCLPADGYYFTADRRCQVILFTPERSLGTFCAIPGEEVGDTPSVEAWEVL